MKNVENSEQLRKALKPENEVNFDEWIDLFGMFIPKSELTKLLEKTKNGSLNTIESFYRALRDAFEKYDDFAWSWTVALLKQELNVDVAEISGEQLKQIIDEWKENKQRFNNLIMSDAQKEYDVNSRIGYGIDGDETVRDLDFERVRGNYETNGFVQELKRENTEIEKLANEWNKKLDKIF